MIDNQTIDEIFSVARIEDIVGDYVQLKRAGSNLKGLSPFSEERTPSFVVSPAKQIWKDFSSGKGGNVVSFLMELEQYSYPEALKYLANRYQIEIKEDKEFSTEQKEKHAEKESLFLVNEFANKYFQNQLFTTENGRNIALSYFKERQFTEETIKKFQLGYSPDVRDALTQEALSKGYKIEFLEKTGLSIVKETASFDRFKGRVMFPILSFSGRVLGFGGRVLKNNDKAAKYLNSPESEIYHKSAILYGIFHAKQAIIKEDNCLLVEGYTDVISLHQAGIENVVSSSGTSLTVEQIRLVKRLTNNITILYDGDAAGIKASFRGIDLILEQDMNIRVLLFPDGEDPDSFARKNSREDLRKYIAENSKDFIQFKTQILLEDAQNDPIKKANLVREIIHSIAKIENLIKREVYIRETASLLKVREETLFKEVAQQIGIKHSEASKAPKKTSQVMEVHTQDVQAITYDASAIIESKLIELLLTYGNQKIYIKDFNEEGNEEVFEVYVAEEIVDRLNEDQIQLRLPLHQKIFNHFVEGIQAGEIRSNTFFNTIMDEEVNQTVSTALTEKYVLNDWNRKEVFVSSKEQRTHEWLKELIAMYKYYYVNEQINSIKNTFSQDISEEQATQKMVEIQQMIMVKNKLAEIIGRFITH